jgi:hypothetical protein
VTTRRQFLTAGGAVAGVGGGLFVGTRLARTPHPIFRRLTFRRGSVSTARFASGLPARVV